METLRGNSAHTDTPMSTRMRMTRLRIVAMRRREDGAAGIPVKY
jgi:hypothetical protein